GYVTYDELNKVLPSDKTSSEQIEDTMAMLNEMGINVIESEEAEEAEGENLSREGEIAIAKRIEAGRELMIGALCESPLTFEALTVWGDELNEGKVLLRDIIDLEAMYGAGPDGQPANIPPPVGPDGKPLPAVPGLAVAAPVPEIKKPVPPPPPPAPKPQPAVAKPNGEGEGDEGEAAAAAD